MTEKKTKYVYVVMRRGFEYNDETYEFINGGNCVKVYKTQVAACDTARALTREFIRINGLGVFSDQYGVFHEPDPDHPATEKYKLDKFFREGVLRYDDVDELDELIKKMDEEEISFLASLIDCDYTLFYVDKLVLES